MCLAVEHPQVQIGLFKIEEQLIRERRPLGGRDLQHSLLQRQLFSEAAAFLRQRFRLGTPIVSIELACLIRYFYNNLA